MKRFEERLAATEFSVHGDYPNHRHLGDPSSPRVLDVFLAIKEGQTLYFNPAKVPNFSADLVLPLGETVFWGEPTTIPARPLMFLEMMYGTDWRTPIKNFTHRWKNLFQGQPRGRLEQKTVQAVSQENADDFPGSLWVTESPPDGF